jgi:hypothetical protein
MFWNRRRFKVGVRVAEEAGENSHARAASFLDLLPGKTLYQTRAGLVELDLAAGPVSPQPSILCPVDISIELRYMGPRLRGEFTYLA